MFEQLSKIELRQVAQTLELVEFIAGDTIMHEGDKMHSELDGMYMLWEGSADVLKDGAVVHSYLQGSFFGELALLSSGGLRSATVSASGGHSKDPKATHCLRLAKVDFDRLVPLGPAALTAILPPPPGPQQITEALMKVCLATARLAPSPR